jgi:hypothetical protein
MLTENQKIQIDEIILNELEKKELVSINELYSSIAEKIDIKEIKNYKEIFDEFDVLVESGTIARYVLMHPSNTLVDKYMEMKMPEHYYTLVK